MPRGRETEVRDGDSRVQEGSKDFKSLLSMSAVGSLMEGVTLPMVEMKRGTGLYIDVFDMMTSL